MTSKNYFRTLAILHLALTLGQLAFAGLFILVKWTGNLRTVGVPIIAGKGVRQEDLFFYAAMAIVAVSILASFLVFRTRIARAKEQQTLFDILSDYRGAVLLRDALLDFPSILAVVAYAVTDNEKYLCLTGVIVLLFLINWPTPSRVMADLGLEDDPTLRDPDAVIDL
jgi:hypothetical protein